MDILLFIGRRSFTVCEREDHGVHGTVVARERTREARVS